MGTKNRWLEFACAPLLISMVYTLPPEFKLPTWHHWPKVRGEMSKIYSPVLVPDHHWLILLNPQLRPSASQQTCSTTTLNVNAMWPGLWPWKFPQPAFLPLSAHVGLLCDLDSAIGPQLSFLSPPTPPNSPDSSSSLSPRVNLSCPWEQFQGSSIYFPLPLISHCLAWVGLLDYGVGIWPATQGHNALPPPKYWMVLLVNYLGQNGCFISSLSLSFFCPSFCFSCPGTASAFTFC